MSGTAEASEPLLPVVPAGAVAPAFTTVTAEASAVSPESAAVAPVPVSAVAAAETSAAAGWTRPVGIFRRALVLADVDLIPADGGRSQGVQELGSYGSVHLNQGMLGENPDIAHGALLHFHRIVKQSGDVLGPQADHLAGEEDVDDEGP